MKLYSVALALAACLSMAAAQGLDGLPDCAKSCATDSIPASCGLDVKCICTDSSFITGISCCILKSCPPDKQQEEEEDAHPFFLTAAVQFANQICKTAGVTNMPQSPSCENENQSATGTSSGSSTTTSGSSTSDPSSTSDSSTSDSSTSDSSTSGSSTKTGTNESNTSQTAATATTSTTSTTGSTTSSATSAAHTSAGAAVSQHKDIGLIAAAGAAVAAFGMLA
ncbi:hypothetical protein CNMCM5623_000701 [Aspergillus felis]|uniref:CFEM domain-containing protein n=1 Tax=Aspergillus felis TaxID=1287682 RepID=A0A8H6PLA8_9EURO|nr:hypothetical protein CNMCM5623_000701 [Aspergillus felis]